MNSGIQQKVILFRCTNKYRWLLLSALMFSFLMISCSPHSIRTSRTKSYRNQVKEKQIDAIKIDEVDSKEFLEAQKQLMSELKPENQNKNDTFYLDDKSGEILPYNSHLRAILEEQDNINRKVSTLQTDVSDMKNTLEMIKSELLAMNGKSQQEAVTGLPASENSTPGKKSNEMLSDEKVNIKTQKKHPTMQTKSVKSNPRTKIVNSNKPKNTEDSDDETVEDFSSADNKSENQQNENSEETIGGFNKAMNEFKNRNYKGAINELHNMLKTEKNKENTGKYNYWIGESHFGLNQYDKAVNYFGKVLNSNNTSKKDDAQIMIAESYARSGNIDEAKKAFTDLISNYPKSRYIARARKMLQQL
jgi:TolA-binding protein